MSGAELLLSLKEWTEERIAALSPEVLDELIAALHQAKTVANDELFRREYGCDPITVLEEAKETQDEPDEDAMFERVVELTLNDLPEALGRHAGRVAAQVLEYGEWCGWDTQDEDTATFQRVLLEGFCMGLADATVVPNSWPERAKVIRAFATVAHLADCGPLVHHVDCFESEKHFAPEQL